MKNRRIPPGFWFLLPGLLGFLLFYILPFGGSVGYSVMSQPVNGKFVGVQNYLSLLASPAYLRGLWNTVKFMGVSVPLNMALSLGVALLIRKKRHRELFTLIFLIPLVLPSGSMAFFWRVVFSYNGALNGALQGLGIGKVNWLDSALALPVMVLIFIWKNMGYNMVLFLSGLHSIPMEYYEAAWVDGASPRQALWSITLPNLAATSVLVCIMSVVNSFKVFREIYLLTGNYPHQSIYTLQHFMNNMFASLNYPKLTTATTILVCIIAVLTQGLLWLERRTSS
ncbi:MAG: sugar ABC transporter permease [Christensenellaceae bacterium]|jgi:multiple sugar transport system permease protein|nr:sugar ABC transporter permease [Christensenellaceae bacterium]